MSNYCVPDLPVLKLQDTAVNSGSFTVISEALTALMLVLFTHPKGEVFSNIMGFIRAS